MAERVKLLRLYRSEKGIWRYEIERDGVTRWSSLHTRDERAARAAYERFARALSPTTPEGGQP